MKLSKLYQVLKEINNSRISLIVTCLIICAIFFAMLMYYIFNESIGYAANIHAVERRFNIEIPFSYIPVQDEVYYIYNKSPTGFSIQIYGTFSPDGIKKLQEQIIKENLRVIKAPINITTHDNHILPQKVLDQVGLLTLSETHGKPRYSLGNVKYVDYENLHTYIIPFGARNRKYAFGISFDEKKGGFILSVVVPPR